MNNGIQFYLGVSLIIFGGIFLLLCWIDYRIEKRINEFRNTERRNRMKPTRDEIMAEDNHQLNMWAAQYIMRWTYVDICQGIPPGLDYYVSILDYATDANAANAAREVLAEIERRGMRLTYTFIQELDRILWPDLMVDWKFSNLDCFRMLTATPRQIVQAALLAVWESEPSLKRGDERNDS